MKQRPDSFFPHVIVDAEGQIAAAGTLFIERKFIHKCGRVAHVEDIVVSSRHRGKSLGRVLLQKLVELARQEECYKIILNCEVEKVQFYEKCGFTEKGRQMAMYF
jgi:glucosamine-phosphate N-acetyltransferase